MMTSESNRHESSPESAEADVCGCEALREQVVEQVRRFRELTAGDVVDGGLKLVRKYPVAGVAAAAAVGFLLGRWFPRR